MKVSARWLYLVLLALVILGLLRLRFDVQVLNILPADLPVVQGLKLYQEHFANARELIVTISAANAEEAESAASSLADRLRKATNLISEVTWQAPWLEHPSQSAELIAYLWFNQRPNIFSELTNRLAANKLSATLASAREQLATSLSPEEIARLSYDPVGLTQLPESVSGAAPAFGPKQELFSSADGSFRILFAQARSDLPDYRACLKWLASVKAIVNSTRAERAIPAEVKVAYTGAPAFVAEISSGMESDLKRSVGSTVLIIILLFWWVHRRFGPLLWLVTLLAITLVSTLGIGGLLFGKLSVVTVGFAAILLGLAVDYGLVLYQESLHAPGVSARELRRVLSPSIVWSAVTTAGAFLTLNLGGLPGLGQLGSVVAIGGTLGAIVMLSFFLPPLISRRAVAERSSLFAMEREPRSLAAHSVVVWGITGVILLGGLIVLWRMRPALDHTANALRPRHSPAYEAMEEIKTHIAREREPEWLVLTASDEKEMARRLDAVEPVLQSALSNGSISSFTLSAALFPHPEYQIANAAVARQLAAQREGNAYRRVKVRARKRAEYQDQDGEDRARRKRIA